MTVEPANFWPLDKLNINAVSPVAMLRVQADLLAKSTLGILRAEVVATTGEGLTKLQLEVVAPALRNARNILLVARYGTETIFPVRVSSYFIGDDPPVSEDRLQTLIAENAIEFEVSLKSILRQPRTIALLQTLIIRSNEVMVSPTKEDAVQQKLDPEEGERSQHPVVRTLIENAKDTTPVTINATEALLQEIEQKVANTVKHAISQATPESGAKLSQ